ncbi:MAG TPA: MBL fold metallo-hydrolase [Spirochaetota bacterium]|nr:MBL fold metallo-hydrolase [Spirochaetota bacterium]
MYIKKMTLGMLATNTYLVKCTQSGISAVIDPAAAADRILDLLRQNNCKLEYILLTHAHLDHILAVKKLKEQTGAAVCLYPDDFFLIKNIDIQTAYLSLPGAGDLDFTIDHSLDHNELLELGRHKVKVIHTPGHSPGSVSFAAPGALFSGDTLFAGSVGRTDLWQGSYPDLLNSVRERLLVLDESTVVYPGHGPDTDIRTEKRDNPFCRLNEQG